MKRVLMITLGCSKNLVDAECMMRILEDAGHTLVKDPEYADVIIVNTCGFIESAKKEAIDTILAMSDHKKPSGNCDYLLVTGCLSQRYPGDILESMPEVDGVLGTAHYHDIANVISRLYDQEDIQPETYVSDPGSLLHMRSNRYITTGQYAWLKIAEGCSNRCAYCAIPMIRGDFQSRDMESILHEARKISEKGISELILTAQDTTRYGLDLYGRRMLPELIRRLSEISSIRGIRIMYAYSDGITDELIEEMVVNPKLLHYLDMPIQHASDMVLKRMNRRDTLQSITDLILKIRSKVPDIILRTTVLVGFPGEKKKDVDILVQALTILRFDRLGCFIFSPEEGTEAFEMQEQVRSVTANRRFEQVMRVQQEISLENNRKRIGKIVNVTIESVSADGIFYMGRSYGEAPEVDPAIFVIAGDILPDIGDIYPVRFVDCSAYDLTGVIEIT